MSDSSSQQEQLEHKVPTSPPTNVVSVLSKMLEVQAIKPEQQKIEVSTNSRKFGFYLDFLIDNKIYKEEIQVEQAMKIQTAFASALQNFKILLAQKGYEMNTSMQNYSLRLAKKNGKPKTDMPSIDLKQRFVDLKVNNSSIQIKNQDCIKKHEQVTKSESHRSIGSEIGQVPDFQKKKEVLSEEEAMRKQRKQNCMFSFC